MKTDPPAAVETTSSRLATTRTSTAQSHQTVVLPNERSSLLLLSSNRDANDDDDDADFCYHHSAMDGIDDRLSSSCLWDDSEQETNDGTYQCTSLWSRAKATTIVVVVTIFSVVWILVANVSYSRDIPVKRTQTVAVLLLQPQEDQPSRPPLPSTDSTPMEAATTTTSNATFPPDFVWGAATSSYQIEGGVLEDGRGWTVWDTFVRRPGVIIDHSTGDVACDHYHRFHSDVILLKSLNIQAYRFSLAWSRILPSGILIDQPNPAGINFYNQLIDLLLLHGIEPYVTLFHWDLPQALDDDLGGWLNATMADIFASYARVAFHAFGDRVKHWITINEPWTVAVNGYCTGEHAPGHRDHPTTEPYIVAHHMLLGHAKAVRVYHNEFALEQGGVIGISNSGDFRYPATPQQSDQGAAERAMQFQFGWFVDPISTGEYPPEMKQRLGDRLPSFSQEEQDLLIGSADFFGLNYYSALLAAEPAQEATYGGYWADIFVDFSNNETWIQNDMGWNIVPAGLRDMLVWISKRYNYPTIFITENGSAEPEPDLESARCDEARRQYFDRHLRACSEAICNDGVHLKGYFAWSLMDNFEWQFGYTKRFGICRVNFNTLERIPKSSAEWYANTIQQNGENLLSSSF